MNEQEPQNTRVIDLATARAKKANPAARWPERPTPNHDIYCLLAEFLDPNSTEDLEALESVLDDVYKAYANNDPILLESLTSKEATGNISRKDTFYTMILFTVAKIIGPFEMRTIRDVLFLPLPTTEITRLLSNIKLDETLNEYLIKLHAQLNHQKV